MLKAKGTNETNGNDVMLLGLSRRNITLLMQDRPIRIDGATMGFPGIDIIVLFGEDEPALVKALQAENKHQGFPPGVEYADPSAGLEQPEGEA
jgi:hypothetical protein